MRRTFDTFKILGKISIRFIAILLLVKLITVPSVLYAQNKKANNTEKQEEETNKFIEINKSFSKDIDNFAEGIDRNISPRAPGKIANNKTNMYFVLGGDFDDKGNMETNFRYGARLHLPRFERYWKVKFDNQDEKRERGLSPMVRSQRTRNTNDDVFVGVSFERYWDKIRVDYKPQIAIRDGMGLDHSIEADTEFEYGKFVFQPSLEFFAHHEDGTGSSASVKFLFWLYKKKWGLEQGNDARFLFLYSNLSMNHYAGVVSIPSDRWKFALHYFRSFQNKLENFELTAYGAYLVANYMIYRDMLAIEAKPYVVFERGEEFDETHGIVLNLRVIF